MSTDLDILDAEQWIKPVGKPLLIAGPCSAESEEQLLATAIELAKIPQVNMLRAGIWKPRTRPGEFEGAGEEGLKWLRKAKQRTNLPTSVEIARPEHIELALKYDVDILWLGARTVVNPFSVQEIAEALRGSNVPIMVKNPINPDIKLWIGAIERINAAGIKKIMAIHRGFHYFGSSEFRNAPMWEIPIELKRLVPDLPIIVDPSHICGRRDLIEDISQKALDLEMDGLMIETHYQPDMALTDAVQQLSPTSLATMIDRLKIRETGGDIAFETKLESLRSEIDKLDVEMLQILAKRLEIIDEIGHYKKDNDITILQMKRWAGIIDDRLSIGTQLGLEDEFLKRMLNIIHKESIQRQTDIFNS
ncbi:MAG: 3-deoxy-7-phosphoheptulonate synthase [Chlorobi bacterium]|nr:3-deoxy-7-phosphoheptulonate synthase [Chlorobiota bacterium]